MAVNYSNHQLLNHDWETQLTMLKLMYDIDDIKVKYIDDENEEVGITNSNDFKSAIKFAVKYSNNLLKLVLKNSKGEVIAKPSFLIDINDKDLIKIIKNEENVQRENVSIPNAATTTEVANDKVLETDILANLPNEKKNWLINYLEQLKKDIVQEMEHKIKDIVLSQSTVLLSNENESEQKQTIADQMDLLDIDSNLYYEEKIKKLLNLLTEARLSERPIKVAFIEEELQLSGALNAVFVKDLTMPDGSKCLPGMQFQKKWLIKNTGRLAWMNNFSVKLVCLAGNIQAQNGDYVNVDATNIDSTTIIGVDLVAPQLPGEYFSEWVLVCNGFKFGPRIWASIEVVEDEEEHSSFKKLEASGAESLDDDEFVVVPACFDLNKDWKTDTNILKKELPKREEDKQEEQANKELIERLDSLESVKTTLTSRSISSQPLDIIVKDANETKTEEMKSPSSFSSLNAFKDALSNVKMPSYVGDMSDPEQITIEKKEETTPKPLIETNLNTTNVQQHQQIKSIISPMSTKIASVSKTMYSAIGSLGSVYQSSESYMDKLINMGFANRTLNNQLLKKHSNDLDKVISELLEKQDTNYRL